MLLPVLIILVVLLGVSVANVIAWPTVGRTEQSFPLSVSVLIPARNEAANLPDCLSTVLAQGQTIAEVLIYNDHSTDGTATIIHDYAQRDARVKPVPVQALEPGWCGKTFACAQLAQHATSEWLLFLDADVRLARGAIARMVEEARNRNLTFLSCWPGLVMQSFAEKALMPLLNFAVFTLYPGPLALSRSDAALGLAHGACMLFQRAAYEKFGGHAEVRDQIFEDTRLAQLWRASGRRGLALDGQELVRVRMYSSGREIWRGFEKNFFPAFRHQFTFWSFMTLHAVVFLLPFLLLPLAVSGMIAAGDVLATAGLILLMRLLLAWRFQQPFWSVLLHPLAEVVLLLIGLASWWRCHSGQGVTWKGRQYHVSPDGSH